MWGPQRRQALEWSYQGQQCRNKWPQPQVGCTPLLKQPEEMRAATRLLVLLRRTVPIPGSAEHRTGWSPPLQGTRQPAPGKQCRTCLGGNFQFQKLFHIFYAQVSKCHSIHTFYLCIRLTDWEDECPVCHNEASEEPIHLNRCCFVKKIKGTTKSSKENKLKGRATQQAKVSRDLRESI